MSEQARFAQLCSHPIKKEITESLRTEKSIGRAQTFNRGPINLGINKSAAFLTWEIKSDDGLLHADTLSY